MSGSWIEAKPSVVKVTDKYYDEALHIDVKNLLMLDADRLLAGFRETAGLLAGMDDAAIESFMKSKKRYGGMWEDGLIGGHTMGHYVTALAQAAKNPGLSEDEQAKVQERLDYVIDSLYECQDKTMGTAQEGYIFGATLPGKEFRDNPVLQFDNVEKGLQELFTQAWVPWYTMHKIMTGLNAAFKLAGSAKALEVDNRLGMWIYRRTQGWPSEVRKTVLSIEYGGMNDCLYELYVINRDLKSQGSGLAIEDPQKIFDAAHAFDQEDLFEEVLSGKKNAMNNVHANTTIPKFIGALARYEADNSQVRYLDYARAFWDMVIDKHTYVTGGNSENEHFGEDYVLDKERTHVNNETCNTYNMLKFSRRLFAATGDKKYLDYSERTLINAIMASQNHETGFTTYFQPMATGFHKVFNTFDGNFWCCTGTGYENFTKLQRGIYYKKADKLVIALYLSSEVVIGDYRVKMKCDFTTSDVVSIDVKAANGGKISDDILLRVPEWVSEAPEFKINEKEIAPREEDGFYVIPSAEISDSAEITARFPMGVHVENLPDGPHTYAFMYGPYVLSARLGATKIKTKSHGVAVTVADGRAVDSDVLKVTDGESVEDFVASIDKHLVRRDGTMEFDLTGVSKPLVFTTHYNQYKECYGIYWMLEA